jgi:hypothetical protein
MSWWAETARKARIPEAIASRKESGRHAIE